MARAIRSVIFIEPCFRTRLILYISLRWLSIWPLAGRRNYVVDAPANVVRSCRFGRKIILAALAVLIRSDPEVPILPQLYNFQYRWKM